MTIKVSFSFTSEIKDYVIIDEGCASSLLLVSNELKMDRDYLFCSGILYRKEK